MTELVRPEAEFLLYQTEDGRTRVEVRLDGETAWLSLGQMAALFQRDKSVISRHVKNVFDEGELDRSAVVARHANNCSGWEDLRGRVLQPRRHHLRRLPRHVPSGHAVPHLGDAAAARVHRQGLHPGRRAAEARGGGDYFDELLARIRAIRSSKQAFWRKVLDMVLQSHFLVGKIVT